MYRHVIFASILENATARRIPDFSEIVCQVDCVGAIVEHEPMRDFAFRWDCLESDDYGETRISFFITHVSFLSSLCACVWKAAQLIINRFR
jgi:hypothetical protein